MLAPLSWLKEYVDIDVDVETLEKKLFSCGFEVEEVIEVGKDITGVYIGLVEKCEKVEGTHLSICSVNVGDRGIFQICCGADNVKAGKKFPVALEGATVVMSNKQNPSVKEVFTIKNTKIRGIDSFGMLCSGDELGLSDNMIDGASYNGLLELDDNAPIGEDFKKYIGLTDYIFDISITANRPDCQSILGIAREIAAVLEKPFKMPETNYNPVEKQSTFKVEIEDFDLCPRYEAHLLTGVKVEKSPLWLRKRLELVGVNPINNLVDVTNYVLKEIGQPMHAFNKEFLQGDKIVVRKANIGEKLVALDEEEYALSESNLVIADAQKVVALAGVMGGLDSGIKNDTTEVVLESAFFERSSVRKTSRELGLASDSSSRFEKGVDDFSVGLGRERALHLIEKLNAGKVVSKAIISVKQALIEEKAVSASVTRINNLLGIVVPNSEILRVLTNLSLQPQISDDILTIKVPPYRTDIETYQDIAEEVIRMYGYEHITNDFLKFASVSAGKRTQKQKLKNKIRSFLFNQGYMESITYSFFSPKDLDMLKLEENDVLRQTIKILNPLKENISLMRTTLVSSMISSVVRNIKRGNYNGRLFEISRVFFAKQLPLVDFPEEREFLSLSVFGKDEDYFSMKGTVELLGEQLGLEFEFERASKPFLHPGISASVLVDGENVGYFGMIAHDIREELSIDKPFFVGELDYHRLIELSNQKDVYKNFVETVVVKRDIAMVFDESMENGKIEKAIKSVSDKIINVELFDIYKGEQLDKGKKSMAYHIDLELLANEDIEKQTNDLMKEIENYFVEKYNAFLRE